MAYSGRYTPKNPSKYIGDPDNIIYRSLWERRVMLKLDESDDVIKWASEEPFMIVPYVSPVDNRWHRYFPDFFVAIREGDKVKNLLIEVKPKKQTEPPVKKKKVTKAYLKEVMTWGVNEAKWKAAKEVCAHKGWKFQLITEIELGIR